MGVARLSIFPAAMGIDRKTAVSDLIAGQLLGHQHARHVAQARDSLRKNRLAANSYGAMHQDVDTSPCWSTARHR